MLFARQSPWLYVGKFRDLPRIYPHTSKFRFQLMVVLFDPVKVSLHIAHVLRPAEVSPVVSVLKRRSMTHRFSAAEFSKNVLALSFKSVLFSEQRS